MWHLIFAFECAAWCVVSTKTNTAVVGAFNGGLCV